MSDLINNIFGGSQGKTTTKEVFSMENIAEAIANPFALLGQVKELTAYFKEHTTKMNNPTNIFASWKRDDETGRQGQEGKECITWTVNDGDQPENEANAVLMFIQWKGNLNFMKGYVTSAQLRKKLRKTSLDDQMIEAFCDELDVVNGKKQRQQEPTVQQPKRGVSVSGVKYSATTEDEVFDTSLSKRKEAPPTTDNTKTYLVAGVACTALLGAIFFIKK